MFSLISLLNVFNVFVIFLSLIVFMFYKQYVNYSRRQRLLSLIPGPSKRYPLIGNLDMIWFTNCSQEIAVPDQVFTAMSVVYQKEGIFRFSFGPRDGVAIFSSDYTRDFLKDGVNIEKPFEYQLLSDWLGKGLLINDSALLWRQRRKLLTPGFHFKILEEFVPIMNEKADILLTKLHTCANEGKAFDITQLIFRCALDVISETTLGVEINSQQNQNEAYIQAVHRMAVTFFDRLMKPFLWPKVIFYSTSLGKQFRKDLKILHEMTESVINERKDTFLKNKRNNCENDKRLAFLDILLEMHLKDNSLSLKDIREEVDTFMFAGHDTTALCMSWTLYLLGLYPEIQHKIQEEMHSIFGDDKSDITCDHMKQMPYLEAVIKESLRLYPPVPVISRKLTHDMKLGDYTVPKGVSLYLLIARLHMDSNVFADPLVFRPERFLAQNEIPFTFIPFSAGVRNCIGQKFAFNEIKIILTKILRVFTIKSLDQRSEIIAFNAIVSKPKYGLKVEVVVRK